MLTFSTWASHLCHFCMQNPNNRFGRYLKKLLSQYWLFTEKPTVSLETSWNVESDHLRFPSRQNKVWLQLSNRTVRRQDNRGRDIRGYRYRGIQENPRGNSWFHSHRQSSPVIASHRLILLELVARSIQIGELRHAKPLRCEAKHPKMIPR